MGMVVKDLLLEDKLDGEMYQALSYRVKTTDPEYVIEQLFDKYMVLRSYGTYKISIGGLFTSKLDAMNFILELQNEKK